MSDVIIECRNLSKRYAPRKQPPQEGVLSALGFSPRRPEPFLALEDVSFEIRRGEAVGVLGENGSGKTTLLKILSGITVPCEGTLRVDGRIGSLLEVGAGFHPDMTGEENIYLSGAILGVSQKEIEKRFDDIVEFSELEEFIEIPVKNYSSGMYVRLGFSVALFTEPDVLLLDEILAVGDEQFQRKCLRAVQGFLDGGGTIVYVSHDLAATRMLCPRALVLSNSHLVFDGDVERAIDKYHHQLWLKYPPKPDEQTEVVFRNRFGSFDATIDAVRFPDERGTAKREYRPGEPIGMEIDYSVHKDIGDITLGLFVRDDAGYPLFVCDSMLMGIDLSVERGSHSIRMKFAEMNLQPGLYDVTVILASSYISTHNPHDWRKHVHDIWYRMETIQVLPDMDKSVLRTGPVALQPNMKGL